MVSEFRRTLGGKNMEQPSQVKGERRQPNVSTSRRHFLSIVPLGAFAGIFATVSAAATRFLQTSAASLHEGKAAVAKWIAIAPIAELQGPDPIMRALPVEHEVGWAITTKQQVVYVLPKNDHKVVSAICPHEGCPVLWDNAEKNFLCPCHDSRFSDSGAHLTGPASGDLAPVKSKVEAGVLNVKLEV